MTRQAVTEHLAVLEEANLVAVVWRGREKLHYLNPVPIHEIAERWIKKFETGRLDALADLKRKLEGEPMADATFVYVTDISAAPEKVWAALSDPEMTTDYWARHRNVSDWKPGSP